MAKVPKVAVQVSALGAKSTAQQLQQVNAAMNQFATAARTMAAASRTLNQALHTTATAPAKAVTGINRVTQAMQNAGKAAVHVVTGVGKVVRVLASFPIGLIQKSASALNSLAGGFGRLFGVGSMAGNVAIGTLISHGIMATIRGVRDAIQNSLAMVADALANYKRLGLTIQVSLAREKAAATEAAGGVLSIRDAYKQTGGEVQKYLNVVQRLALTRPVREEDIAGVFRVLAGYQLGTDAALKFTEKIADFGLAAGVAAEEQVRLALAIGQMKAKGKLAGEEMRQFSNVYVTMEMLVTALNKKFPQLGVTTTNFYKMMRDGALKTQYVLPALYDAMDEFSEFGRDLTKNWAGIPIMFENISRIVGRVMLGPVFEEAGRGLGEFIGLFDPDKHAETLIGFENLGKGIADSLVPMVNRMIEFIPTIEKFFKGLAAGGEGWTGIYNAFGFLTGKGIQHGVEFSATDVWNAFKEQLKVPEATEIAQSTGNWFGKNIVGGLLNTLIAAAVMIPNFISQLITGKSIFGNAPSSPLVNLGKSFVRGAGEGLAQSIQELAGVPEQYRTDWEKGVNGWKTAISSFAILVQFIAKQVSSAINGLAHTVYLEYRKLQNKLYDLTPAHLRVALGMPESWNLPDVEKWRFPKELLSYNEITTGDAQNRANSPAPMLSMPADQAREYVERGYTGELPWGFPQGYLSDLYPRETETVVVKPDQVVIGPSNIPKERMLPFPADRPAWQDWNPDRTQAAWKDWDAPKTDWGSLSLFSGGPQQVNPSVTMPAWRANTATIETQTVIIDDPEAYRMWEPGGKPAPGVGVPVPPSIGVGASGEINQTVTSLSDVNTALYAILPAAEEAREALNIDKGTSIEQKSPSKVEVELQSIAYLLRVTIPQAAARAWAAISGVNANVLGNMGRFLGASAGGKFLPSGSGGGMPSSHLGRKNQRWASQPWGFPTGLVQSQAGPMVSPFLSYIPTTPGTRTSVTDDIQNILDQLLGGATDDLEEAADSLKSAASQIESLMSDAMKPSADQPRSWAMGTSMEGILSRDAWDEPARRWADVAKLGKDSPWFEGFRSQIPADIIDTGGEALKGFAAYKQQQFYEDPMQAYLSGQLDPGQVVENLRKNLLQQKSQKQFQGILANRMMNDPSLVALMTEMGIDTSALAGMAVAPPTMTGGVVGAQDIIGGFMGQADAATGIPGVNDKLASTQQLQSQANNYLANQLEVEKRMLHYLSKGKESGVAANGLGSASKDTASGVKGGLSAIGAANGLNMLVPNGYPNDSYRISMGLTSGERVMVIPRSKMGMFVPKTAVNIEQVVVNNQMEAAILNGVIDRRIEQFMLG